MFCFMSFYLFIFEQDYSPVNFVFDMLHMHDHGAILLNYLISEGILLFSFLPYCRDWKGQLGCISKVFKRRVTEYSRFHLSYRICHC